MKEWSKPELSNLEAKETKSPNHGHCDCGHIEPMTGSTWTCSKCGRTYTGGLCNCPEYVAPSES